MAENLTLSSSIVKHVINTMKQFCYRGEYMNNCQLSQDVNMVCLIITEQKMLTGVIIAMGSVTEAIRENYRL